MADCPDLFEAPISTMTIPSIFPRVPHPIPPKGCKFGASDEPIHTNNFYNNLADGDQSAPIWTLPYSLWLNREPNSKLGLAMNHTTASQRVYGPDPNSDQANYFFNPPRIRSWTFSGKTVDAGWRLTLADHKKMLVNAQLKGNDRNAFITFPLVQGMPFLTAIYNEVDPVLELAVGIRSFQPAGLANPATLKYVVTLNNGVVWLLYAVNGILELGSPSAVVGRGRSMLVQVCRVAPDAYASNLAVYDGAAGMWPSRIDLKASVRNSGGTYSFEYAFHGYSSSNKAGLVWALPHHQDSLSSDTARAATSVYLDSPTKGPMRLYATNNLEFNEPDLPSAIAFDPWALFCTLPTRWLDLTRALIQRAAEQDAQQDIEGLCVLDSMYFSGKALDKFAHLAYVCHFYLRDSQLARKVLVPLKRAIEVFAGNRQPNKLVYDLLWKGLISSADPAADFGNAVYNDHHFHYGYHIHAIALVGRIDPAWLDYNNGLVRSFVTTLIRDVASPSLDGAFPAFRCFDWFHGHSWAHGIVPLGDGKDEESLLEDYHFLHGMKLWAIVLGDKVMKLRADLMLAIMRRSINLYMLFHNDNKLYPSKIITNKVLGIAFENKIDYATYFGRGSVGDEWIHGIHMLPVTGVSLYMRPASYVAEEWQQKCIRWIDRINDGWRGVLTLNLALSNPQAAWAWFSHNDWSDHLIDQGMSRTWLLAFIASIGGAPL